MHASSLLSTAPWMPYRGAVVLESTPVYICMKTSTYRLLQADGHSAINEQARSVDVSGRVAGQEERRTDEIFWYAEPAKRYPPLLVLPLLRVGQVLLVDVCLDRPCEMWSARSSCRTSLPSWECLPGKTELHLIFIGPRAIAQLSIRLLTPAFVGV